MKKYLVIEYISGQSGGYGDRLVGLVSAIQIAQATNRQLLIKWDNDNLKNHFDYDDYDYYQTNLPSSKNLNLNCIDRQADLRNYFINTDLIKEWQSIEIIMFRCNCNLGQYLYLNPHLKLNQTDYKTDLRTIYQDLYRVYLKPRSTLQSELDHYLQRFQAIKKTDKTMVGLHVRTGDRFFRSNGTEVVPNQDLIKILTFFKDLLENRLNQSPETAAIFLCYDNPMVEGIFRHILPDYEFIYHSAPIEHLGIPENQSSSVGFQKIIIDQILLSKVDQLLISNSNLARNAYLISQAADGYCLRYFKTKNEYQAYKLTTEYASSKQMGLNIWLDPLPTTIYQ